ncbi:hypothetical protein [Arenibaculum pallidiluteum]|uniref:hypothetical protein n=1 Tax=Arenibaculum pallidiluteum TaxID=2812559 RepID=UPI001A97BF4E|nr:hypothetical protein [Arenibaculum pallidiluteum]
MAIADTRLRICVFPQRWDGSEILLRVLVAPFGNPLDPLDPGLEPFSQARLALAAELIPGADRLPRPEDVTARVALGAATPPDIGPVYAALAAELGIDPAAPAAYVPPAKTRVLKLVMPSYLEATGFTGLRTEFAVTDNRFVCALVDGPRPVGRPPRPPVPRKWDAVLAAALRQPALAERLGLIYTASVQPDDGLFENGGWLYVGLDDASDYAAAAAANPDFARLYAARIPPLRQGVPATVFAPVLFPVAAVPPAGSFDEILHEADVYSDGFARLVHAFQPDRADYLDLSRQRERRPRPYEEVGLKLGWDDEQILIWLNRQITDDPRNGAPGARDTPLGIRGFRVDVRDASGSGPWASLVRMQGALKLGTLDLGAFDGEMAVELAPSQLQGIRDGEYWLPPYFTRWMGGSLIAADATAFRMAETPLPARVLNPVGERAVPLRYGTSYEFRVRLADITGGGPGPEAQDEPPSAVGACRFRRFVPPGAPRVAEPVASPDGTLALSVGRPALGYPALVYTPLADAEARLLADAPSAAAEGRLPGFPDPDVVRVRIDVSVASLESDPGNDSGPAPRRHLYTTFRDFPEDPAEPLPLVIAFEDAADIGVLAASSAGPLRLPTARTVDLTFTPIARRDPGMSAGIADPLEVQAIDGAALDLPDPKLVYFGKQAARLGVGHTVAQRRGSADESGLFETVPGVPFQGVLLQPGQARDVHLDAANAAAGAREQAPERPIQRLARQLRLESRDLTLSGPAGRRAVFGASAGLRHVLAPDHSTITFASETEITAQWLLVVPLRLARDWTWDALADEGLQVLRSIDGEEPVAVGTIAPRRMLNAAAVRRGVPLDRSATDLFFLDAINPRAAPGTFPRERQVSYTVVPRLREAPSAPAPEWTGSLRLPVAASPVQVPRIVSAGIALSVYGRDRTYARTEPRRRMLWVEFAEPVADPRDAYFGRVTMYAADPMLLRAEPERPPGPLEPPLNIDPEAIRAITAGQAEDESGLGAMQRLIPAGGEGPARHFLLPLPPTLSEASPDLFGFFVYEFRVGHAEGWSTAQARFGLPQRVTGVQHPAPALTCGVARTPEHIRVSAPFATPVSEGRAVHAVPPTTDLWALLYAQVRRADGADWRNVLIGRTRLDYPREARGGDTGHEPHGVGRWDREAVEAWLDILGLPRNAPLSVLALELLPEPGSPFADPLGADLGQVRVLRTSPLTPVPPICLDA